MKKITKSICSLLLLSSMSVGLAACGGCGCGKEEGGTNGNGAVTIMPKPDAEASISFSMTATQMTVGDEYSILYRAEEGDIVWESSNHDIATVRAGVITAMKPGEAKITASLNGDKAEISVKVVTDGLMPSLHFENGFVSGEAINTVQNGTLNFASYVLFNTKRFDDMQVTYAVDDESKASIDGTGKFVAKNAKGTVNVTATATWRGIASTKMTATFPVSIVTDTQILFGEDNKTDLTLYTVDSHGGDSYATSYAGIFDKLTITSDGQACAYQNVEASALQNNQYTLEMTAGADVASWNAATGTVTALKAGKATLTLTVKDADGAVSLLTFPIEVLRPVVTVERRVEKFSTYEGQIGEADYLRELFGKEVTLTAAYQGGDEFTGRSLTVNADNTVHGLVIENFTEMKEEIITVYDDEKGYQITVEAYTQYIDEASDLNSLFRSTTATISGYFYVANDIHYDDSFEPKPYADTYAEKSSVFTGIFDGQGHTIEYALGKNGLFGTLGGNSLIKNVSFVVKGVHSSSPEIAQLPIIAKEFYGNGITLENVYATYDFEFTPQVTYNFWGQTVGLGLFENANSAGVTMKNVVVDMSKVTVADPTNETASFTFAYGPFTSRNQSNAGRWTYENTYVIFNNPYVGFKRKSASGASASDYTTKEEIEGICYAENTAPDGATATPGTPAGVVNYKLVGVKHFVSQAAAKTYFDENAAQLQALQGGADTSLGYPVAANYVSTQVSVAINDSAVSEYDFEYGVGGTATVALSYKGQPVTDLEITHASGAKLVTVSGATLSCEASASAGEENLRITATVEGRRVEKLITIRVNSTNLGTIYFDTEATLPDTLDGVTVTKVVNLSNANEVYFDGTSWQVAANTSNSIVEYDALVYGEGNAVIGSVKIGVVTKLLKTAEDMKTVYYPSSNIEAGYYMLANDILYAEDPFTAAPTMWNTAAYRNTFKGVLDGNGHTLEYKIKQAGLLGQIGDTAVIKNISLIVKGVDDEANAKPAMYPILAGRVFGASASEGKGITIENVYMKYDIESFTPNVDYINYDTNTGGHSSGAGTGLGISEMLWGVTMRNVIVDMSKVQGVTATKEAAADKRFGVFGSNNTPEYATFGVLQNTYVIWSQACLGYETTNGTLETVRFAENDQAAIDGYTKIGSESVHKLSGVNRYTDYAAMVTAGVTKVGSYTVTNTGVTKG